MVDDNFELKIVMDPRPVVYLNFYRQNILTAEYDHVAYSQCEAVVEFNPKHGISTRSRRERHDVSGGHSFGFGFLGETEKVVSGL